MPIVLLSDLTRSRIEAEDLLVGCSSHEQILLVLLRVEHDAIGNLLVGEFCLHLTGLSVPKFYHAVIRSREELAASSVERHVTNALHVTGIRSDAATSFVELPQLHAIIH